MPSDHAVRQILLLLKAARIGPVNAVLRKSEGATLEVTKTIAEEIDKKLAEHAELIDGKGRDDAE